MRVTSDDKIDDKRCSCCRCGSFVVNHHPFAQMSPARVNRRYAYESDNSYDDSDDESRVGLYDVNKLRKADGLLDRIFKTFPGRYTKDELLKTYVKVFLRAVAVRHSWYDNQKRLYSTGIFAKIRVWAPHLFKYPGGIYALIQHATDKGVPITYDAESHRFNVGRLIKPVIKELQPHRPKYRGGY